MTKNIYICNTFYFFLLKAEHTALSASTQNNKLSLKLNIVKYYLYYSWKAYEIKTLSND